MIKKDYHNPFFCDIFFLGDKMYGAIIGDLAGSIYEFDQIKGKGSR